MKKLLFRRPNVKSSLNIKVAGDIFFSALIFLMFAATMITGKIMYYHTSARAYTALIQQNEAQVMKNLAVANDLHDEQELKFNMGKAKRSKDKCIVWLNNQKKFEFSIASWKDEHN